MRLVVCHDAGGAELLSSHLRRSAAKDWQCVVEGPARAVFERKLGAYPGTSLSAGLAAADSVLCGTSWQSSLEFDALGEARTRALPSIAFLDHWVNYRERFERAGVSHLPNRLWVGDEMALARARPAFPGLPVEMVGNPYLEDIRDQLAALPGRVADERGLSVLFVCEPVSTHEASRSGNPRGLGYDEHEALRYFLQRLDRLGATVRRVVVRPHPSEQAEKYRWAVGFEGLPVALGGGRPLLEEIVESDLVAGCESMAMVTALVAGKRVLSCIPPGGRACVLPFPEIERLPD